MRLLKIGSSGEVTLVEFPNEIEPPPYAILSHTWGADEVVFEDFQNGLKTSKLGYRKIQFCAEQARKDNLEFCWVDTCCINKAHLTELSEAIVSMFRWYRRAAKCYVYLADVSDSSKRAHDSDIQLWRSSFQKSRWFTRGWTLQELLAPASVEFFSVEGQLLGNRTALMSQISEITTIPVGALHGAPLVDFTIQERMRWAASRNTTKIEDKAYCLLGIFEVYMSPIYGERENATSRLIEEISKSQATQLRTVGTPSLGPNTSPPTVVARQPTIPSTAQQQTQQDRRSELLELLSFKQMDDRRDTIGLAHSKTCTWLLSHPRYMDWIDPEQYQSHNGFLWIKGKPGAGKSTLVKYALSQACKSPRNSEIILSYFFNARGDELERSTSGLYRSFLHQLLTKTEIQRIFDGISYSGSWTTDQLRELCTCAIRQLEGHYIKCYVDALDECDEQEIRDMIAHFKSLGQISNGRFCVCFASRHYPTIVVLDGDGTQLLLENESGHHEDLARYVKKRLKVGTGRIRANLETQLLLKANSVFMWAVLVIDILNEEFRRGSIFNVQRRLDEIPAELSRLFEDILLRDCTRRDHLLLCIQWVLFARRPLKLEEFYFAMAAGLTEELPSEWDPEYISVETMRRFVSDSSKGLAELTKSSRGSPKLQFIHESVRDFLFKDGGLYKLWPELEAHPKALSHTKLRQCCERSLMIDLTQKLPSTDQHTASRQDTQRFCDELNQKYPFLGYAVDYVFDHADEAAEGMAGNDFLTDFNVKNWITIWNSRKHPAKHRYTPDVPLQYILAHQNSGRLIRRFHQLDKTMPSTLDEFYHHPLLVAISNKNWDAVRAILEPYNHPRFEDAMEALERQHDISVGKDVNTLHWAIRKGNVLLAEILIDVSFDDINLRNTRKQTPLWLAARKGFETIVDHLFSKGATESPSTALVCAAEEGHDQIVKMSLEKCADGSDTGFAYQKGRALRFASSRGHLEIVKRLCESGANPYSINGEDSINRKYSINGKYVWTALEAASQNGHDKVVKLLLEAGGTDTAFYEPIYSDALQLAIQNDHQEVMKLLLEAGSTYITPWDQIYHNALKAACRRGYQDIVKLLLYAVGTDAAACEQIHRNALKAACERGHKDIVKLLLDAFGIDTAACDCLDNTALQKIGALLLDASTDINTGKQFYSAALKTAFTGGDIRTVKLLLDRDAEPNFIVTPSVTALLFSLKMGNHESAELLINAGADIDFQGGFHGNALQLATVLGKHETIKLLLDRGADVNLQGDPHGSALQAASVAGRYEIVKLLLDRGADVDLQGGHYGSALQAASVVEQYKIVELLLDRGADINLQGALYGSALQAASIRGRYEIVELLLDRGADVNLRGLYGSALQAASVGGHYEVVKLLLERGADVNIQGGPYGSALRAASAIAHQGVVDLLLENGADSNL